MKLIRIFAIIIVLIIGTSFMGCGGGGAKVQQATITTTIGQELMDLEKAYKEGLISEKEYNKQKKKILKRKQ